MKKAFRQNMSTLDRVLRVWGGIVLLVLAALVARGGTAIVLVILSVPLLIPGITGVCPSYSLLGISTKRDHTTETR